LKWLITVALAGLLQACTASPPSPTLVNAVTVTATGSTTLQVGSSTQLVAIASTFGGVSADVTSLAAWVSQNSAIATVGGAGLVTGLATGTVSVSAQYGGVTGTLRNIRALFYPPEPACELVRCS
jgi:uncharacterized protein YjdB